MIKEDYVSFEIAKLLKEKGFDGEFHKHYWGYQHGKEFLTVGSFNPEYDYPAPTHQMAMKWLREVHNIFISSRIQNNETYICYLYDTKGNGIQGYDKNFVQVTFEEAVEVALKYVLENLI